MAYGIGGGVLGAAVGAWAMHEHDKRKETYPKTVYMSFNISNIHLI
jgi:hypothetical protein